MASRKRKPSERPHTALQYDDEAVEEALPRDVSHLVPPRPAPDAAAGAGGDLVFQVLDVAEGGGGAFSVWGTTPGGASVLVRVADFEPYFFIAAPVSGGGGGAAAAAWSADDADRVRRALNRHLPGAAAVREAAPVRAASILYYRPASPSGGTFLRLALPPGGNARRAGTAVLRAITGAALPAALGAAWRDTTVYESEVAPLQRFLVDAGLAGGAWVWLPPAGPRRAGYAAVPERERRSDAAVEVAAPWRALRCLSPDATQLADAAWSPFSGPEDGAPPPAVAAAAAAALRGDVAPLRVCVLDVLTATADGAARVAVPERGDPVVSITCMASTFGQEEEEEEAAAEGAAGHGADGGAEAEEGGGEDDDADGGGRAVEASAAAAAGGPRAVARGAAARCRCIVFQLQARPAPALAGRGGARDLPSGARVVLFEREAELLLTWEAFMRGLDPDVIGCFQVGSTLKAISERWAALRLRGAGGGAGLRGGAAGPRLSRLRPGAGFPGAPEFSKVTMYSAAWVKSQRRMSATSNQETWRADVGGRVVFDALRHMLTAANLGSYSLEDGVQSLVGETLEVLPPAALAGLAGVVAEGAPGGSRAAAAPPAPDALRAARHAARRCAAVRRLLARLSTVAEAVEMARACGQLLWQTQYNAQMAKTWSLLLRAARRRGRLLPNRAEAGALVFPPFLLHPVEEGSAGLYKDTPVAILDFASLYPSLYQAHNMCYSTLVHADDAAALPAAGVFVAPSGAVFVRPAVQRGVLPDILAALVGARAAARRDAAAARSPAARAVLDARQKALKVTANALYGFTGAPASPLQCGPLADACLALGAEACRSARAALEAAGADGRLGPRGAGARVIYGHTDSLFLALPGAAGDAAAAAAVGRAAAAAVSAGLPPPMELRLEHVCLPLLLLHVNRYAARAFECEADAAAGRAKLLVKGLKTQWRQSAQVVRTTLLGALERVLLRGDAEGAAAFVEAAAERLLRGRVDVSELIMTGGLWRVTGEQVEKAAAAAAGGGGGDEVRGPHAALAVRLARRDAGRAFVLGERLQYVLLAGHAKQEDAAEEPLAAAAAGAVPDFELYWRQKVVPPVREVLAACVSPARLHRVLAGPHTLARPDALFAAAAPPPQAALGKGKAAAGGGVQTGLASYFRVTANCLGCRRPLTEWRGAAADAPGLCRACAEAAGDAARARALLDLTAQQAEHEARRAAAHEACRRCHSGLVTQPVLCAAAECPVTYARLGAEGRLAALGGALRRLDIDF